MPASFRRSIAAICAAVALAGCSSGSDTNTLTIWHSWGGAELDTLKAVVAGYEKAHPGIDVMPLQIPHDRLLDKYTRSSASNGGPDLLIGDNDWSGKLAQSELVAPIFDEAASASALFPVSDERQFSAETLAALRLDHKIYAWPESVETVVLYYNKKLVPTPPATVASWLSLASHAHPPDGYGLAFNTDFYFFAGYFLGGGGEIFDRQGNLQLDTPGGVAMLAWLDKLTGSPGVLGTNDYGKADSLYKQGKAAMIVNGPWALADYQKALGPDLGVAPLPLLDDGHPAAPWIGVKCVMVNANADARHRQLAADFCRYLDEPSTQLQLSKGCGHIPAVVGVPLPPDSPLGVFQDQARTGTPKSADPRLAVVWDPMSRAIQEVLTHKYPPAKALERTQETVKAKLAAVEENE